MRAKEKQLYFCLYKILINKFLFFPFLFFFSRLKQEESLQVEVEYISRGGLTRGPRGVPSHHSMERLRDSAARPLKTSIVSPGSFLFPKPVSFSRSSNPPKMDKAQQPSSFQQLEKVISLPM